MRPLPLLVCSALAAVLASCTPAPPSSSLPCESDAECAAGHSCQATADGSRRCSPDAADAAVPDPGDGGAPVDAGRDGGVPDSGTPDSGRPDSGTSDSGTPDSGTPDSGTADGGALDGGTPDASLADGGSDAGASEDDWPADGWAYRRRLTLAAPDEDVPAGALLRVSLGDTDALMRDGQALASGDDLRVWHFDGATWRELPRVLAEAGNLGGFRGDAEGPPRVMLRAVRAIPKGTNDDGYWLFTGNDQDPVPPTAGVPAARTLGTFVDGVSPIVSTTPQEVASVSVQPSSPDEVWIVVATWQQRYGAQLATPVFEKYAGAARVVVDGVPRVPEALQSIRAASGRWQAGAAFEVLHGDTVLHTVALEAAATSFENNLASPELREVRLLAFLLPAGADELVTIEEPAVQTLAGDLANQTTANFLQRTVDAVQPGAHLWLAHNLLHEHPGDAAGAFTLSLDGTVVRATEESWMQEDAWFHSLFHVGEVVLGSDHEVSLDYVASVGGSEVAGIEQVFAPLHGFARKNIAGPSQSVSSTTPAEVAHLDVPATELVHELVYLGVFGATHDVAPTFSGGVGSDVLTFEVTREAESSLPLGFHEWAMSNRSSAYTVSVVVAAREERSAAAALRIRASTSNGEKPARVEAPFLLWLRYPEVSTTVGELVPAP